MLNFFFFFGILLYTLNWSIIYCERVGGFMAKSKASMKRRRRMLFLGLSSIIVIVATTFTIGKYWIEIYDKYQEKKHLEKELISLKNKEKQLKVDANKLQDPDYIARYAREKYLYSKDGEFILKIPEE